MGSNGESPCILTSGQVRAGRALLGWRQQDLSLLSGISLNTIKRIEQSEGPVMARLGTIKAIEEVFTEHGLSFMNDKTRVVIILDGQPRDNSFGFE